MYEDVVRKLVLLSSTEKGTKLAYQPNLAVLGLSSALSAQKSKHFEHLNCGPPW